MITPPRSRYEDDDVDYYTIPPVREGQAREGYYRRHASY